jgi:hypothetical protein
MRTLYMCTNYGNMCTQICVHMPVLIIIGNATTMEMLEVICAQLLEIWKC